ncbi:MAG: nucleotidyltransferase domain-containing protein [Parcubacteria group bacterium]|nr:nucleotidyltransferase domain-containing protein [Parcubacteria group bacterium]
MNIAYDQKELARIAKEYDVRLVLLHGSFATGRQHKDSDIDIAVLTRKKFTHSEELVLHQALSDVFSVKGRELDIKSINGADPLFLFEVMRDSQLLYGDDVDYEEYKAYAFRAFHDAKDLFALEDRLLEKYQAVLQKTYA